MKFLCVPCDQAMKLTVIHPPDRGSLSVVYGCPACGYEMAMLTNAHETQLVSSLGVRIGPAEGAAGAAEAPRTAHASGAPESAAAAPSSGKSCPFAAMIPGYAELAAAAPGSKFSSGESEVRWTAVASARLEAIPAFVRPMARAGVEKYAAERGLSEVTEHVLDEAREHFGM